MVAPDSSGDDGVLADGLAGVLAHGVEDGLPYPADGSRNAIGILYVVDKWLDAIGKRVGGHRLDRATRDYRLSIRFHQQPHDRHGRGATPGLDCEQAIDEQSLGGEADMEDTVWVGPPLRLQC